MKHRRLDQQVTVITGASTLYQPGEAGRADGDGRRPRLQ